MVNDTNNGCGGAARIESHLTGTLGHDGGWCVAGVVERYEGTREPNHDLDGSRAVSGCTGPGGMTEIDGRVRNTNEGGDWADYRIDLLAG